MNVSCGSTLNMGIEDIKSDPFIMTRHGTGLLLRYGIQRLKCARRSSMKEKLGYLLIYFP